MNVFAIGDLHLSLDGKKPMGRFGEIWLNHSEKIRQAWLSSIQKEDLVLLCGDLSWAMHWQDAKPDLTFLAALPGRKILLRGNHDYWWTSVSKLRQVYPTLEFIQNDCVVIGAYAFCGSRGWICPRDSYFTPRDQKLYERELKRLKLSLEAAVRSGAKKRIAMLHFPPFNDKKEASGFSELLEAYQVETVVYGHLHGDEAFCHRVEGMRNGVLYHLVSADFLSFAPKMLVMPEHWEG